MMGSILNRLLLMVVGYINPGYECYKAIEFKNKTGRIERLLFWCKYWILVSLFTILERVGDHSISWLPLYGEAKVAFLFYLWHSKTRGAESLYNLFVKPYVAEHEKEIDGYLVDLKNRSVATAAAVIWQQAASFGRNKFSEIMQYVSSVNAEVQKSGNPSKNVAGK